MRKVFIILGLLLVGTSPARAAEYRLQVANLYRDSLAHYFDGPLGTGSGELSMVRLENALDTGDLPAGVVLSDRTFRYAWEAVADSFIAVKVVAEIRPGEGSGRWDEVVWEGKPGERSVWVIAPTTTRTQEVIHVALKGAGVGAGELPQLRYYVPYRISGSPTLETAVTFPLQFLRFYEGKGSVLWARYLSRSVSLGSAIAAVVGENANPTFTDWVYVVVQHPPLPATFKAVVGWHRRRGSDRSNLEGAGARE